jgi:hypothetical protein
MLDQKRRNRREPSRNKLSKETQTTMATMAEYIETLDPWEAKLLQQIQKVHNHATVATKIMAEKA